MLILGIDSSSLSASAALCEIDGGKINKYSVFSLKNGLTHSENLLVIIDGALSSLGVTAKDLDLIAVTAGPGSFTGVRIGVATAKGLAFPYDTPVCGVSALEAIALGQALPEGHAFPGGIVVPLLDARRSQFYTAAFEGENRLIPDSCLIFDDIYKRIKETGKSALLCGDGAELFYSLCEDKTNIFTPPPSFTQSMASVAFLGYKKFLRGEHTSHYKLRPIYLRAPQAERERLLKKN
ncbi:MAG: tRNA (adenosine(37)-N6)-threonylcarbamoyltransferase complex dimerization subunit type 1 TsaB [Eubacteriales bacterium]